jgi:hypothetical protein
MDNLSLKIIALVIDEFTINLKSVARILRALTYNACSTPNLMLGKGAQVFLVWLYNVV